MSDVTALASAFAGAHSSGSTLVLPTVWDVWSARVAVDAGFTGLTIGSHPVADSLGSADGENMDFADYLEVIGRITASVEVPVSADVESGYGLDPRELVERLLEAGAVGSNIEDVVHSEGGRVRDRQEHADYIGRARQAADEAGVEFVINGRTDAVRLGTEVFTHPIDEAAQRIVLMEQAGARSVYPVGLSTDEEVLRMVEAAHGPVNVTAHPVTGHGAGGLSELAGLGVRRVSFGPLWQMWLAEESAKALAAWRS